MFMSPPSLKRAAPKLTGDAKRVKPDHDSPLHAFIGLNMEQVQELLDDARAEQDTAINSFRAAERRQNAANKHVEILIFVKEAHGINQCRDKAYATQDKLEEVMREAKVNNDAAAKAETEARKIILLVGALNPVYFEGKLDLYSVEYKRILR